MDIKFTLLQKYFVTIRASSESGSVVSSSDGVLIIQDNDYLHDVQILDGLTCTEQGESLIS